MEKHPKKGKSKSKTPIRPYLHLGPEEIKDLQADLSKFGNSSVGLTERTMLTESPDKRILVEEYVSIDDDSIALLKFELEAKQNIIGNLVNNQKDLRQNINTLKAQNNSLHKELNSCRAKNYELDVELYLAKEEICAKDKELEKIRVELDNLQGMVKGSRGLREENLGLKEEIQGLKGKFEKEIGKMLLKNQELVKMIGSKGDEWEIKAKKRHEKSEDFTKKTNSQSVERGFKLDNIRICRNYQASLSPEKMLNYTERPCKNINSIVTDLQTILNIEQPHKILPAVVQLKESGKTLKRYKKFFNKLSQLVIDCSPSGVFYSKPNLKQVWIWITRLLEEYMKLKKDKV